jgi:Fe-S cluster biogenesis protein NfuA
MFAIHHQPPYAEKNRGMLSAARTIPMAPKEALLETLRDVVAPLVELDGGELYFVTAEADEVRLHLSGVCAGCPGATLTTRGVIEPAMKAVSPQARVIVTAGVLIPPGATRVLVARKALSAASRPLLRRPGAASEPGPPNSGERQQRVPVE